MNHNLFTIHFVIVALAVAILAGCGDRAPQAPDATSKDYPIQGTVTAIGSDKESVTLDHEDIPGLMKAMEMKFAVSDPKVLEGIAVGDAVEGELEKADELVITRLQKQ